MTPNSTCLRAGPPPRVDQADAEDEDAQVGDDASELGGGALLALRPA